MTPKLDSTFFIFFKSNNQPWGKRTVLNENGDTIRYKRNFTANTTYRDTLQLAPGLCI